MRYGLQDKSEAFLRNVRVSQTRCSHWTDATVYPDRAAMLACGDRIDEEPNAEKGKGAS